MGQSATRAGSFGAIGTGHGAVLRATAKKRSLIERAKRLTYEANEKHLPQSRKAVGATDLGSLKGVDSSTPVPGEG